MNKCYMHNPESVSENEMHKVLLGFKIQSIHLISARRQEIVIVSKKKKKKERKKENLPNSRLGRSGRPEGKTERKLSGGR